MKKYNIETQLGAISQLIEQGELIALAGGADAYLVCNALNEDSISKALQLKGESNTPLVLYAASLSMVNRYVHNISHEAYTTAARVWPSSVLFVLPAKKTIPYLVTRGLDSAVFSCPTEKIIRQISCLINAPLVLVKVDSTVIEKQKNIAVAECNLPFIQKRPIIFDGRDKLRRIETEDLFSLQFPNPVNIRCYHNIDALNVVIACAKIFL